MGPLDIGAVPSLPPHHGYRFPPVRRRKSSSYRTPMRYPWWGSGGAHARTTHTSLPSGDPHHTVLLHSDAVSMGYGWGSPSAMGPLDVGAVPSLPPHHGYRFPPVRRRKSSSYRTPTRYPWWGSGGAHARTTHTSLPSGDPHHTVSPHSDAVSMGYGWGSPSAWARLTYMCPRQAPPWAPHRGAGRRCWRVRGDVLVGAG